MRTLTITTETYTRTESGRSWRSRPDYVDVESLPWDYRDTEAGQQSGEDKHRKITENDTLRWFRRLGGSEYAERSYTPVGYIVTRLVSTNPDRTVRVVRKFKITRDDLDR